MGENSKIEWTDHTFNPWIGCQKVSAGCDHCYAETQNNFRKWNGGEWGPHAPRKRTSPGYWKQPRLWAMQARTANGRPRVFCASLADVFDNQAPEGARADLWALIRATPELDWLLLTKRPENIAAMLPVDWRHGYPNVWLGATCEDQVAYNRRWPLLREVPARVRFISYEPALGPLDISTARMWSIKPSLHWLICGGESGPSARPMNPQWARDIRGQCADGGIAFLHKQNGEWVSVSEVEGPGEHFHFPDGRTVRRVGKKRAGRVIDGVEYNGFPQVSA